jgi:serine protease Do
MPRYLAREILQFFNDGYQAGPRLLPYSMMHFVEKFPELAPNVYKNVRYCKRLEQEGLLDHMGDSGSHPFYKSHYYTNKGFFDEDISRYGGYDSLVEGLISVRERFSKFVLPVSVELENTELSVGTCFLYKPGVIITARHCIEGLNRVSVLDGDGTVIPVNEVHFPRNERIDLAVLYIPASLHSDNETHSIATKPEYIGPREMDELNYIDDPSIVLFAPGKILSDILTMGYPPISGFESIQIADRSSINSSLFRTSKGEVLANEKKFIDGIEYLLINAKVKGGNSGGPVFDQMGRVVGMIVEIPTDFKNHTEIDRLGYGLAIPSMYIKAALDGIKTEDGSMVNVPIQSFENGSFRVE